MVHVVAFFFTISLLPPIVPSNSVECINAWLKQFPFPLCGRLLELWNRFIMPEAQDDRCIQSLSAMNVVGGHLDLPTVMSSIPLAYSIPIDVVDFSRRPSLTHNFLLLVNILFSLFCFTIFTKNPLVANHKGVGIVSDRHHSSTTAKSPHILEKVQPRLLQTSHTHSVFSDANPVRCYL